MLAFSLDPYNKLTCWLYYYSIVIPNIVTLSCLYVHGSCNNRMNDEFQRLVEPIRRGDCKGSPWLATSFHAVITIICGLWENLLFVTPVILWTTFQCFTIEHELIFFSNPPQVYSVLVCVWWWYDVGAGTSQIFIHREKRLLRKSNSTVSLLVSMHIWRKLAMKFWNLRSQLMLV